VRDDELRIVEVHPEPRCPYQPWKEGEEFARDPSPAGGHRNWPDQLASYYQGRVRAGMSSEARFAALLPVNGLFMGVFLRGDSSREAVLARDFELVTNGATPAAAERVKFPVPAVVFLVPAGFERVADVPAGVLGEWRRKEEPAGELVVRRRMLSDMESWKPDWDLVMQARPKDSVVYDGWTDGRLRGFDGAEKPGAPLVTARAVLLPVGAIAIEVQTKVEGRQWITVWNDAHGLQVDVRAPGTGTGGGICGGSGPSVPWWRRADWQAVRIGTAMTVLAAGLAWLAWQTVRSRR
jgi:hypothetical protein